MKRRSKVELTIDEMLALHDAETALETDETELMGYDAVALCEEVKKLRGSGNNVLGFDASKIPRDSLLMAHGYAFGLAMNLKKLGLELSETDQAMGTKLYGLGSEAQLTLAHFAGVHHSKPEPQAPADEDD